MSESPVAASVGPISDAVESLAADRVAVDELARQMNRLFDAMTIRELQKLKSYLARESVVPERPRATDAVRILASIGMQYSAAVKRADRAREPKPRKEIED